MTFLKKSALLLSRRSSSNYNGVIRDLRQNQQPFSSAIQLKTSLPSTSPCYSIQNSSIATRLWSNNSWSNKSAAHQQSATTINKKKKRRSNINLQGGASAGRIALVNVGGKKSKSNLPKLCSGCGVEMVSSSSFSSSKMATGEDALFSARTKRQEKKARYADILDKDTTSATNLCQRCVALQSGNIMDAYDALKDVDASVFMNQLSHVVSRRTFGLCVVVVDATDPEFSSVSNLRDAIKSTPAILAINKVDLLPQQMNKYELNYIKSRIESGKRRTRVLAAYAVSAQNGLGMVELAKGILSNLGGKDVFVVGSANVGKSTLVKSLASLLSRTLRFEGKNKFMDDKRRNILQNLNVTQSHLPGTTLQAVRIPCFPSVRHALWDTPGIINSSALAYSLFPSHFMEELAYPTKIDIPTRENRRRIKVRKGYSILIEAGWITNDAGDEEQLLNHSNSNDTTSSSFFTLARLDIVEDDGHEVEVLAFIPSCLNIRLVRTDRAPTDATIPEKHVKKVQRLVGDNYHIDAKVSRPLVIFKGSGGGSSSSLEDGVVNFHCDEYDNESISGWIRRDIVFASLGWIMLTHRRPFSVKPWCVKDSRWSKRRSWFPSNLERLVEENMDDEKTLNYDINAGDGDPAFEEIKAILRRASDQGKRAQGDKKLRDAEEGYSTSTRFDGEDDYF
jgi:ribosome biogenesis GTPase A